MKCPACQSENRQSAAFCAFCGSPLPASPEPDASKDNPQAIETKSQEAQESPEVPLTSEAQTASLEPGNMLGERFEVLEVIEQTNNLNTYRVRDWCRCPHCGYDDNTRGDRFCLDCGADLNEPVYATLVEKVPSTPDSFDLSFTVGNREYYLTLDQIERVEQEQINELLPLKITWGWATDKGITRDHNEDYVEGHLYTDSAGASLGLFIVADGLGGQDSGEVASKLTTTTIWKSMRQAVWEPLLAGQTLDNEQLEKSLSESVIAANDAVLSERTEAGSSMSTTVTMALISNSRAFVANVGDSRTYLWNASGLRQISHDHSLVQQLIDAKQISREDAYSHPQRNLIYQSIGDGPNIKPDTFEQILQDGDRLILCSDGLWEMVRDDGIERIMLTEMDPTRAANELIRLANLAGGEDNISVIVVRLSRA